MHPNWAQAGTTFLVSFLAAAVEAVEALTVVLAVGTVRGWKNSLAGGATAIAALLLLVTVLGKTLLRFPLHILRVFVGILLLVVGLRWLRKAILRSAGRIPYRDEDVAFTRSVVTMRGQEAGTGWDRIAFGTTFQVVALEGLEVVFIVVSVGAGREGLDLPASLGAVTALLFVSVVGIIVHRPLAKIPENALKFFVGIFLSAFGTFWVGEGFGLTWPGGDLSVLAVLRAYYLVSTTLVRFYRRRTTVDVAGR